MSGELQPFDTERYVDELSRIIGSLEASQLECQG